MGNSEFVVLFRFCLKIDQVKIHYQPVNLLAKNIKIDNLIEIQWQKMLQEAKHSGQILFNSLGYNINLVNFENNQLDLNLSDTTYRQYVTTFRDQKIGKLLPLEVQPKLLSVFGVIETSDNYLVFGQSDVSTRSGGYVTAIGGVVKAAKFKPMTANYLFNEYARETAEETGIPLAKIVKINLIGVVVKNKTANTPRLVFKSHTSMSRQEVEEYFSKSDKENQKLIYIKNNSRNLQKISSNINSNWTLRTITNLLNQ